MSTSDQLEPAGQRRAGGRESQRSGGREGLRAFGLSLASRTRPPGAWVRRPWSEPGVELLRVDADAVAEDWSGAASLGWRAQIDGAPFRAERGRAGDHRFAHGERTVGHLSADGAVLRCAPDGDADAVGAALRCASHGDAGAVGWRVLLDSVLFSVALIAGYEALHAGAVASSGGALAIAAAAGGGKSTLLAELIVRGHALLSDDVVVLEPARAGRPLAHPGPPLMTVPIRAAANLGPAIASIADERWLAVPTHAAALPLAALVLLDRRPGLATELLPVRAPLAALLGSLLAFPRAPERERARFELAGALAAHTALWRLTADPAVDPRALADVVLADLPKLTRDASLP